MDITYGQLDEVKVEGKKLGGESVVKTDLSDSLRAKNQQQKLEIDKLAKELHAMSEEIIELRKMYEEVQSSLHRKELLFNQISSANEKLEADCNEKILKLEGESRDLVLSLDEAFARIRDVEEKTAASSEEISGLKWLLSIKQQLNSEMQKNASIVLKARDEYILKLEEESRINQDQLKWKNERFSHLEEAHRKLQTLFQASKLEWQKEKSSLLDEISSLQGTLAARSCASESLEAQLRMSNQALSNAENRRKVLEIEVLESRSKFEDVFLECQVANSEIDQSTMKREDEIAELRILLRKKEILANEMKKKIQQPEQENSDQEVQVNSNATYFPLEKLKNTLQCAQQLNGKCGINLTEEAEWNSQIEKLRRGTSYCLSQLAEKNRGIRELHKELEEYSSLLEVQSDEIFVSMMILKSELYVAYSKLHDTKEELEQRCDEVAVLVERVESLKSLNQKDNLMEEELKRYKAMLGESKQCESHLKQQFLELENAQAENIKNAVERVNIELQNKTSEIEAVKFELQRSESGIEILKLNLKENQQAHEQEKTRLLATVNDKDAKIGNLEQQISMMKSVVFEKSETAKRLYQEKDNYIRLAEERNWCIQDLHNEIAQLRNKLAEREVASVAILDANNTLGHENERLISSINDKDQKMQELQKEFESLDQDFKSATISLAEKEVILDETGFLTSQTEPTELGSYKMALWPEEMEKSDIQELRSRLEMETRCFENLLKELESHKQALLEDQRVEKINKENMLAQFENMCQQIGLLCREDVELTGMLGKLSHPYKEGGEPASNLLSSDGVSNTPLSRKSVNLDERIPLAELNVSSI
ncbi:hypothetical protein C2S52_003921 [Perilla frutescens var. hirtella]|nr:hypothetical protein C2S51_011623 [Perilla frutescens var. frutescens]KAH6793444.1 hypothetical protein C2S52_003921 [Perilla frutescens var. hirtella]